mmetsp:Transcript_89465/g.253494  ORF Transcript_89465/g.253494 Transcript_89465/m.253494 type:complete len:378 (-) Transcript_89465:88-1221(-)
MLKTNRPTNVANSPLSTGHGSTPVGRSRMTRPCTRHRKATSGPTARQLCHSCLTGNSSQMSPPRAAPTFVAPSSAAPSSKAALVTLYIMTVRTGTSDANVTIPKPSRSEPAVWSPPRCRAREVLAAPTPRDRTTGTVAGPVVIAPQSHDRPTMPEASEEAEHRHVRASRGVIRQKSMGLIPHRYCKRSSPPADAMPTPHATAIRTRKERRGFKTRMSSASPGVLPFTSLCRISPTSCRLLMPGSLKVTSTPRSRLVRTTTGSGAFSGSRCPMDSPNGMRPFMSPSLKMARPAMTHASPAAISSVKSHCSRTMPVYKTMKPARGTTSRLNSRMRVVISRSPARPPRVLPLAGPKVSSLRSAPRFVANPSPSERTSSSR